MTRMDFQNARDVKQAAAKKLRAMGHTLHSRCKQCDVVAVVELELGRSADGDPLRLMLEFLEDKKSERATGASFNHMERPALKFSKQMQLAAERAQDQPKIPAMATNVDEFRALGRN